MNLRNELKLSNAYFDSLTKFPKDPEPSRVLVITAPLTPTIAEVLQRRDMIYDINDNPRKFEGGFVVESELVDVEIKLGRLNGALLPLSPKAIRKFRVGHDAKENLTLTFRVHFVGYGDVLDEWTDEINNKAFDVVIMSRQGELFSHDDKPADGEAGGTRVDMSGGDGDSSAMDDMIANVARAEAGPRDDDQLLTEFGPDDDSNICTACRLRIPFEDAPENTTHVTGPRCSRNVSSSTLSPAALSGGTHQSKRGRRERKTLDIPHEDDVADVLDIVN
jgi:hypothetical protein